MLVASLDLCRRAAWMCIGATAIAVGGTRAAASEDARGEEPKAKPSDGKKAKGKLKSPPGIDWLSLEAGLFQVRAKRLPALILLDLPKPAPEGEVEPAEEEPTLEPHFLQDVLTDSSMKETLRRFVLIRIQPDDLEKPYPPPPPPEEGAKKKGAKVAAKGPKIPPGDAAGGEPAPPGALAPAGAVTIGAKLGLGGQQSALVAINYWESAELTYKDGNPPTRTRAREDLARFWKVNGIYAEVARRVEPDFEKSKYAAVQNNQREATLKIRDYEAPKWQNQMDPVLKKRVNELIQEYRARAQKAIEAGNELDKAKKWNDAINAFDKVMTDFPFPDIQKQANIRTGECLRKMTFGV